MPRQAHDQESESDGPRIEPEKSDEMESADRANGEGHREPETSEQSDEAAAPATPAP